MKLDSSYLQLPSDFFQMVGPERVPRVSLLYWNHDLAKKIDFSENDSHLILELLKTGGSESYSPFAQAYGGHQFGRFNILGDGRAVILGEFGQTPSERFDLQFKGSGPTQFSRRGDGKAALGPMVRELIISEAMSGLNIPTTRSLALYRTNELVAREEMLEGGILLRQASSHIRVGTFEWAHYKGGKEYVQALADYSIQRHFPQILNLEDKYLEFLKNVIHRQAQLISHWLNVGFIHGVMNTDNMAISGETIDYGPCAFMDKYNPSAVFSSIDQSGRYAYGQQPSIAQWNLSRFAETLLELLNPEIKQAVQLAESELKNFQNLFLQHYYSGLRKKLGLSLPDPGDSELFEQLFKLMKEEELDFNLSFVQLGLGEAIIPEWQKLWKDRIKMEGRTSFQAMEEMRKVNPVMIPRNYWVEKFIDEGVKQGITENFKSYLKALKNPFDQKLLESPWSGTPELTNYRTFCGT